MGISGDSSHDLIYFRVFVFIVVNFFFFFLVYTYDWSDGVNVPLIYDSLMTCWAAAIGKLSLLQMSPSLGEETVNDQREVNCP